jgi:hypothetical protein
MIRSTAQTTRLLILPYAALLVGYLVIGAVALIWLELQAREAGADLSVARAALLLSVLAGAAGILAAFLIARVAVRDGLCIEVDDRGCGIAPADLSRVFTPFFTTKSEGHGLGLAVVRRIVESHHGRIRVENRQEGGVRVTLILPLEQPEIPAWWKAQTTHSRT